MTAAMGVREDEPPEVGSDPRGRGNAGVQGGGLRDGSRFEVVPGCLVVHAASFGCEKISGARLLCCWRFEIKS